MDLGVVLWGAVLLFPAAEIGLAAMRRARFGIVRHADEGSAGLLWLAILTAVAGAIASQWVPGSRLPGPGWLLRGLALALLCAGLGRCGGLPS